MDEPPDLEMIAALAEPVIREMVFRSARLHLEPEEIIAGVLVAWHGLRHELPGADVLHAARELAAGHVGGDVQHPPVEHGQYL